jgi:hypothetical protein
MPVMPDMLSMPLMPDIPDIPSIATTWLEAVARPKAATKAAEVTRSLIDIAIFLFNKLA